MAASTHNDKLQPGRALFLAFRQAGLACSMVTMAAASGSVLAQSGAIVTVPNQAQAQAFMQPTAATGEATRESANLQRSGSPTDAAFNRADRDRDGRLSRQEAEHFPALALSFEQIDRNHDSFISREEFNSAVGN